jgi:hypothetical protein
MSTSPIPTSQSPTTDYEVSFVPLFGPMEPPLNDRQALQKTEHTGHNWRSAFAATIEAKVRQMSTMITGPIDNSESPKIHQPQSILQPLQAEDNKYPYLLKQFECDFDEYNISR